MQENEHFRTEKSIMFSFDDNLQVARRLHIYHISLHPHTYTCIRCILLYGGILLKFGRTELALLDFIDLFTYHWIGIGSWSSKPAPYWSNPPYVTSAICSKHEKWHNLESIGRLWTTIVPLEG